jgi:hypothetical protein
VAEPWELICHHTYTGIPGVVYDLSPGRRSHAAVVGLSDRDFLTDGVAPRSGAVRFSKPGARLLVPPSESWQPIGAITAEVTVIREHYPPGGTQNDFLIDSDSFQFYIRGAGLVAWFSAAPYQSAEVSTHSDLIGPWSGVPTGRWITLGFLHDGFGTMELSLNGEVVARRSVPLWPVNPAGAVTIGNSSDGLNVLYGQLDEVKVWRRNPRKLADDFLNRPMDDATAECWARFGRELAEAMRRHPHCAARLRETLGSTVTGLLRDALNMGPETRQRLQEAADRYRALWRTGRLDSAEMTSLLLDLTAWMQLAGLPLQDNPAHSLLQDGECQALLRELPSLDCDPQFSGLIRSIGEALARRDPGRSTVA